MAEECDAGGGHSLNTLTCLSFNPHETLTKVKCFLKLYLGDYGLGPTDLVLFK